MSLQKLANLLPKNTRQLQSNAQVEGAQVCKLWNDYAQQYFLDTINKNHEAINFREGVLTVVVDSAYLAGEVRLQQNKIISRINQALGKTTITSVRYLE